MKLKSITAVKMWHNVTQSVILDILEVTIIYDQLLQNNQLIVSR